MGILSCGAKVLLKTYNAGLSLVGFASCAVAVYYYLTTSDLKELISGSVTTFLLLLMSAGAAVVVIASFGSFAVCKGFTVCMAAYTTVLGMACLLLLTVGFTSLFVTVPLADDLVVAKYEELKEGDRRAASVVRALEAEAKCCGLDGPGWYDSNKVEMQSSCCPGYVHVCSGEDAWDDGCRDQVGEIVTKYRYIVSTVAFVGFLVALVGVGLSVCYICTK